MTVNETLQRCKWADNHPLNIAYHDLEWGVPEHDESRLFEMLTLEGAQAGLSWLTILKKRDGYRRVFEGFDPQRVAAFDQDRIEAILQDAGIVRHRGKIESTVNNARCILSLWQDGLSLNELVWSIVKGSAIQNQRGSLREIPAKTNHSALMSRELKKRGFRFVGETTCYAFMQAAGLVNDHEISCPRHAACQSLAASSARSLSD
jgi:DNA-3-methyladenine glycosylase I